MSSFKFTAKDPAGKTVTGVLDAPSHQDAINAVRKRTLIPLEVKPAGAAGERAPKTIRAKARKGEVEIFTRQLATMIGAGIPLLECLEILEEQAESRGFRSAVHTI